MHVNGQDILALFTITDLWWEFLENKSFTRINEIDIYSVYKMK